jgi:uncharacterized membrane protein
MQTTSEMRERLNSVHLPSVAPLQTTVTPSDPAVLPAADQEIDVFNAGKNLEDNVLTAVEAPRLFDLVELILKDRPRLERIIRDPSLAGDLIPRFLAISLVGFTFFGISLALIISAAGIRIDLVSIKETLEGAAPRLMRFQHVESLAVLGVGKSVTAALRLIAAYDLGLIAAAGVCLPSLYFYGLLAGVPMSMARVTVHTLKGMATSATALVGILPIYMAFSLGAAVFEAPVLLVDCVLQVGLLLPFGAGLFGAHSLYAGFSTLAGTLPADRRCQRACLLRRLVVSWSVCYAAVTPVMIYTLWEYFGRAI